MSINGCQQSRNWSPEDSGFKKPTGPSGLPCVLLGPESLTSRHVRGPPGKIFTPVPFRSTGFSFVSWTQFDSLSHFSARSGTQLLSVALFTGFVMHPTDECLVLPCTRLCISNIGFQGEEDTCPASRGFPCRR